MKLVFATNNNHKIVEVQQLLKKKFELSHLNDIGCYDDLAETGNTLEANARQKAEYVHRKYKVDCFADDTGLEIKALNEMPGVYSARYAGEAKNADENIKKVLNEMKNITHRSARFRTVVSLFINGKEYLFEGAVNGIILNETKGKDGFGYDPIFQPRGFTKSFAEMPLEEKNKISHRAIAINKLVEFLNGLKISS